MHPIAIAISLLLTSGIIAVCSAHAADDQPLNGSSTAAAKERPDPDRLLQSGSGLVGDGIVPPNANSKKTPKQAFTDGVNKVIDGIENKKPIELSSFGNRADFLDVEEEFGIPENSMGCVVYDTAVLHEYRGMKAALRWYADRGIYPINSLKARMAKTLDPKLQWKPLVEGLNSKDQSEKNDEIRVYLSANDPEFKARNTSFRTIYVRDNGKDRKFRSMYIDLFPKSKYAFDKTSDSIWIDSSREDHPNTSVYNIDMKTEDSQYGKRCPPKLAWRPFLSKAQIGNNEGVFIQKNGDGLEIHYQPQNGPSKRVAYWTGQNRWKTSKWAFDQTRQKMWISEEGPERHQIVFQIERPTLKAIKFFDLSDQE